MPDHPADDVELLIWCDCDRHVGLVSAVGHQGNMVFCIIKTFVKFYICLVEQILTLRIRHNFLVLIYQMHILNEDKFLGVCI